MTGLESNADLVSEKAPMERRVCDYGRLSKFIPAIIFAIIFCAYYPAIQNELLPWDDQHNIIENPYLHPPGLNGLVKLWTQPYDRLYIPLFYTSFFPEIFMTGAKSVAFRKMIHFDNIVLHGIASILVFLILRIVLSFTAPMAFNRSDGSTKKCLFLAAGAGALLFALHPIQAEAVAWATGRKDLLSGLFALAAIWNYLEFVRASESNQGQPTASTVRSRIHLRYIYALVAFLLALLSKPAAVAVPLVILALDFFALRRPIRSTLISLSPFFALSAFWVVLTARFQNMTSQLAEVLPPATTRPFVAADAIVFYLGKIFAPVNLSPVYGRVPWKAVQSPWYYFALPLCLVLAIVVWRKRNIWAAAAAAFLMPLIPVLGLIPFDFQRISTVADRYMYLSMFGVSTAAAAALMHILKMANATACDVQTSEPEQFQETPVGASECPCARIGSPLFMALAFSTVVLGSLFVLARWQAGIWLNTETLWKHAAKIAPDSAVVRNSLGMVYGTLKEPDLARIEFEAAIKLEPKFAGAHNNLANLLGEKGEQQKAVEHWEKAIEADPKQYLAQTNLANHYFQMQQAEGALKHSRAALETMPGFPPAVTCLASTLAAIGKADEALSITREALQANPGNEQIKSILTDLERSASQ